MTRTSSSFWFLAAAPLALAALGCTPGGVGDPCIPEDEYQNRFSGYAVEEVNVESRSFQCETRVCLVNHFQGRVSCPYGQTEADATTGPKCFIPGYDDPVLVAVSAQLYERQAKKAVYCSCRCDGPDDNARYCECPDGYSCTRLVDDLGLGRGQLAGSYCVRNGTEYDTNRPPSQQTCAINPATGEGNCGPSRPQ